MILHRRKCDNSSFNKISNPADADGCEGRARVRARAVAYLTVQIAVTLKFGARDKVTAQIVINVTSARDLHRGAREITRADTGGECRVATDSTVSPAQPLALSTVSYTSLPDNNRIQFLKTYHVFYINLLFNT